MSRSKSTWGCVKAYVTTSALRRSVGGKATARVWGPSREHGFHVPRHFFASEGLEADESLAPGFTLRKYSRFLPRAGA